MSCSDLLCKTFLRSLELKTMLSYLIHLILICLLWRAACEEALCPESSKSTALLQRSQGRSLQEESVGCPCVRGPCFENAPWSQLEQSVRVQHLHEVTEGDLKTTWAQHDALWVTNHPNIAFHGGMMGSPSTPGWTELNSTPSAYVDVRSTFEASETINFARTHNIKLVIMSTGHDWFGRRALVDAFSCC